MSECNAKTGRHLTPSGKRNCPACGPGKSKSVTPFSGVPSLNPGTSRPPSQARRDADWRDDTATARMERSERRQRKDKARADRIETSAPVGVEEFDGSQFTGVEDFDYEAANRNRPGGSGRDWLGKK